jgi:poly(3-hydroxybutyrate) depolymerase
LPAFVDRLLDRLGRRFRVDRRRVFATGFSNGGFLAYRLACSRSEPYGAPGGPVDASAEIASFFAALPARAR